MTLPNLSPVGRALALVLLGMASCSDPQRTSPELVVAVSDPDGQPVDAFVAILDVPGEAPLKITCPAAARQAGELSCEGSGLSWSRDVAAFALTLKVRPYAFARLDIESAELPVEQGARVARVMLHELPKTVGGDDYATQFDAKDGLAAFRAFAYQQSTEMGPAEVVKFYLDDVQGNAQVYFQNTRMSPLHYDFVRDVLGKALSLDEFEARTYRGEDRTAMAGSIVLYPSLETASEALGVHVKAPLALTFFPSDDLTVAQAQRAHFLVEQALGFAALSGGEHRLAYVPAGERQETELASSLRIFAARDSAWMRASELFGEAPLQILNPGLAYGTLRVLTPEALASTVVSFQDILVLTRLPNELPIVAGTISEERQTPLAHVNVAARTRRTPNISLLEASNDPTIVELTGKLVRFEVTSSGYDLRQASQAEAEEHWQGRAPKAVVPDSDLSMSGLPAFAELGFDDAIRVGAKAANLAELGAALGDLAPEGFAVPFFYFDQHMRETLVSEAACDAARGQCSAAGREMKLCARAHAFCMDSSEAQEHLWAHLERLMAEPEFAAETSLREASLAGLAALILDAPLEPSFAAALDARVAELFDGEKVKLRSSTNAEDLPGFSGAGLYESVGAYATGAQAASRRISEVYASVFAFRAFEERSYWNIDHRAMRMGVAVNRAIGDEQVNGVLITQNIADSAVAGMYVNLQKGESPVTNPTDGSLPEIFSIVPSPDGGVQARYLRYSSLSPDEPLLSSAEIDALYEAAWEVQTHFAPLYGEHEYSLALELELKFFGPERRLLIKQARPYSTPSP